MLGELEGMDLSYALFGGPQSVRVASLRIHGGVWGRMSLARRWDPQVQRLESRVEADLISALHEAFQV